MSLSLEEQGLNFEQEPSFNRRSSNFLKCFTFNERRRGKRVKQLNELSCIEQNFFAQKLTRIKFPRGLEAESQIKKLESPIKLPLKNRKWLLHSKRKKEK